MSGARACAADEESGGTEGDAKRNSTETRGVAAGMKSPHPVAQTAQPEADAASPQQPSSDKSACCTAHSAPPGAPTLCASATPPSVTASSRTKALRSKDVT